MNKKQSMFAKEYAWRGLMTAGGLLVIVITICIGAFLVYKGSGTFTIFHHSLSDFLFSADWGPADNAEGGGTVGAFDLYRRFSLYMRTCTSDCNTICTGISNLYD